MLRIFKQYYPIRHVFFVIGEFCCIYIAVLAATWLLMGAQPFTLANWISRKAFLIAVVSHVSLYYNDLYDPGLWTSFGELGLRLIQSLGFASIFLAGVYFVFPQAIIGKGVYAISVVCVAALVIAWRCGYFLVLKHNILDENIIILGSGPFAREIIHQIHEKKDCGYAIALVVLENINDALELYGLKIPTLYKNNLENLESLARHLKVKKIVVALSDQRGHLPVNELLKCRVSGINVIDGTSYYEMLTGKLLVEQIKPAWLIFSDGFRKSALRRFVKRTIDIGLSFVLSAGLLPLLVLTALLIKLDSKGPVFFSQERVGARRRTYMVHKFRSMIADAEQGTGPVWASEEDPRITRVGRIIRKLRIDELPQIWNVLKGNMSFVGPRPERPFFVGQLIETVPYYEQRFSVKPGITGWAQVSYGYGASAEDAVEKLNYDLFYIKNMTIFMDLMIVLRTVKIVLFGKGAR